MAVYSITHSCGCEDRHSLSGPQTQHSTTIRSLSNSRCLKCRNDDICSEHERVLLNYFNLSALRGDELKISQAKAPRFKALNDLVDLHKKVIQEEKIEKATKAIALSVIENIARQENAQFWIGTSKMIFDVYWLRDEVTLRQKK